LVGVDVLGVENGKQKEGEEGGHEEIRI